MMLYCRVVTMVTG